MNEAFFRENPWVIDRILDHLTGLEDRLLRSRLRGERFKTARARLNRIRNVYMRLAVWS